MTAPAAIAERTTHAHRDCPGRERIWLEKDANLPASAIRHPYCLACGTVRNLTWPRAHSLGYYLEGIATLKDYLDHDHARTKLAQVQSHLITTRLKACSEYEDPYGTPGQRQLDVYVDIVRSVRPDLDDELVLRLLPGPRRRRGKGAFSADEDGSAS